MHETIHEGERVTMRAVGMLAVPARSRLEFKPGGNHVMLIGLTRALVPGETTSLVLHFAGGGTLQVMARIRA